MRKLMMKMSFSADGFVGDANGGSDSIFKSSDPESRAWAVGLTSEAGLIVMGSKSFRALESYWPTATGPFAAPMNEIPKAVFTQKGLTPNRNLLYQPRLPHGLRHGSLMAIWPKKSGS
jgi:dihydrofolate reductase